MLSMGKALQYLEVREDEEEKKGEWKEACGIVKEKSGKCPGSWKMFQGGETSTV